MYHNYDKVGPWFLCIFFSRKIKTNAGCIKILDFFNEIRMVSFSRFFDMTIIVKFLMCSSVLKSHHNECTFVPA